MEKEFNRSMVRDLSQKIQEILNEQLNGLGYDFTLNGGNFSSDKLKINLEVRLKTDDGSLVVSESSHRIADGAASRSGVKFEGHLIGSKWKVKGSIYEVVGYVTKRPSYPLSLKREDGRSVKAPLGFLSMGKQLTTPSLEDFTKWFTMDPDSDAILESDAEICDKVQTYMENNYPIEEGDKFFELVDKINDLGIAERWAKRAYELLFLEAPATIESAYLGLKVIYSDYTKTKKTRKSKSSAK